MQTPFSQIALQLNPHDNLAIAKADVAQGAIVQTPDGNELTIRDRIPAGHKFALRAIEAGAPVLRYGCRIGDATQPIQPGEWVHAHNLSVGAMSAARECRVVAAPLPAPVRQTFQGYRRADGRVGTRNYLAVIASANCAAHVAVQIARAFDRGRLAGFPNVDGVIPIVHSGGCSNVLGSLSHRYGY